METNKINLFVFDTIENFENNKKENKNSLGSEGSTFKSIVCVEDRNQFEQKFTLLAEDEFVFMIVHVFYTKQINGIKLFEAEGIKRKYPKLGFMFVSEGDSREIKKQMLDDDFIVEDVHKYHKVQSNLEDEKFKTYTKKEILQLADNQILNSKGETESGSINSYPQCDYAIITALELAEMEKILPILTETGRAKNRRHRIKYGHLSSNPEKKIVYASQLATGMIDAAILATELIIRFKPKFLIMAGVLGGRPDSVKIGDAVIPTKIFTIDKGKITGDGFKPELESVDIDGAHITDIKTAMPDIINFIEKEHPENNRINIHFEPIASVRQVIDLAGYFKENIEPIDRKGIALEMESYGVARACKLVSDGETEPLIIKSVMDNTIDKNDKAKPYAAWTSAKVVQYILENNII